MFYKCKRTDLKVPAQTAYYLIPLKSPWQSAKCTWLHVMMHLVIAQIAIDPRLGLTLTAFQNCKYKMKVLICPSTQVVTR